MAHCFERSAKKIPSLIWIVFFLHDCAPAGVHMVYMAIFFFVEECKGSKSKSLCIYSLACCNWNVRLFLSILVDAWQQHTVVYFLFLTRGPLCAFDGGHAHAPKRGLQRHNDYCHGSAWWLQWVTRTLGQPFRCSKRKISEIAVMQRYDIYELISCSKKQCLKCKGTALFAPKHEDQSKFNGG